MLVNSYLQVLVLLACDVRAVDISLKIDVIPSPELNKVLSINVCDCVLLL